MIISSKLLKAADYLLGDARFESASFIINCDKDGDFTARVLGDKELILKTEKKTTFEKALFNLFELCYKLVDEETGDEE